MKKVYIPMSREESERATFEIGLRWNPDQEDYLRRWINRKIFESLTPPTEDDIIPGADNKTQQT